MRCLSEYLLVLLFFFILSAVLSYSITDNIVQSLALGFAITIIFAIFTIKYI